MGFLKDNKIKDYTLLHCVSSYPTKLADADLKKIIHFKNTLGLNMGYSDHTGNIIAPMLALTKNISFLECHVKDTVSLFNPDHSSSISLEELNFLSKFKKKFYESEKNFKHDNKDKIAKLLYKNRLLFSKSLCLKKNKKKGELIKFSDLTMKKPGNGLKLRQVNKILNKKLKINKSSLRLLKLSDFEK